MDPVGGKKQLKRSAGVLVWTAFVGWIPDGYFVQYRDGNRRNLWVKNLYLKSNSEFRKEVERGSCSMSMSPHSTSGSSDHVSKGEHTNHDSCVPS